MSDGVPFGTLVPGQVFKYNGDIYVKIFMDNQGHNAVQLYQNDGVYGMFQDGAIVYPDMNQLPATVPHVFIEQSEYDSLMDGEDWLLALEAAGVDNWEGYDFAREIYNEEKEE
jgi:hypothetical protein